MVIVLGPLKQDGFSSKTDKCRTIIRQEDLPWKPGGR
jgi:hypothetical protein